MTTAAAPSRRGVPPLGARAEPLALVLGSFDVDGVRVLDASEEHARFAVEVMAGLGAHVERAPVMAAALARADVAVGRRDAQD
jgi:hypothetical protein